MILDCWLSVNPKTGAPSRETNFEAFDGDTPLGGLDIVITEAVTTKPGGPLATNWINDPGSSSPPNGIFEDEKGLRPNQWGPVTLYQSFTVSVDGGPAYSVPVVIGTTSSSYLTVQCTWDYRGSIGRWFKGRKDYNVIVNGQGRDTIPTCK